MGRITINVEAGEAGLFHATSPQMRELFVTGTSVVETIAKIPEPLEALWALQEFREKGGKTLEQIMSEIESGEGQSDGA